MSPERENAVQATLKKTSKTKAKTKKSKNTANTAEESVNSVHAVAKINKTQPLAAAAGARKMSKATKVHEPASIPGARKTALTSSPSVSKATNSMPIAKMSNATYAVSAGAATTTKKATVHTVTNTKKNQVQ